LVGFQNGAFDAVDGASRQLQALGHIVRLLPPSYVKAYLKRSKNDANENNYSLTRRLTP
jgi:transposase